MYIYRDIYFFLSVQGFFNVVRIQYNWVVICVADFAKVISIPTGLFAIQNPILRTFNIHNIFLYK